jgi:hypothetical protein
VSSKLRRRRLAMCVHFFSPRACVRILSSSYDLCGQDVLVLHE